MSYDLYFTELTISLQEFGSYFKTRPHYEITAGQAIYQNQNTGVYFIFEFNSKSSGDDETAGHSASFSLNYYRPHYFGLEAVDEVTGFVEQFQCSVNDPQIDEMQDGPYAPELFLKGWNYGNRFTYSSILETERPIQVWSMPTDRLEAIWRWNYNKEKYQQTLTDSFFVPRIYFAIIDGEVSSMAVWPDAISELIPEVDYLLIGRDQLAPGWLFEPRRKDECIIPFSEVRQLLSPYKTSRYALPAFRLPSPVTPPNLKNFVRSLKPSSLKQTLVRADQVLNSELVNEFLQK